MEDLVEATKDILPEDFGYVGEKWGAVVLHPSGPASIDETEMENALAERGFDVNVWSDSASPRARITKRS